MFAKLFLLFAILPIIEIALLINVGESIGGWNTVAIVIVTAFIGAYLVREQGFQTMLQARHKMQHGQAPGQEMAEGLLLLVAGVLLVTPGFITDVIGFLFALPMTRPLLAKAMMRQFGAHVSVQTMHSNQSFYQQTAYRNDVEEDRQGHVTIEGEYQEKD